MKKLRRYYSRLMTINTLVFAAVILIFGMIAFFAVQRARIVENRLGYDKLLSDFEHRIREKQDDFANHFEPLYSSKNEAVWNEFLLNESDVTANKDYEYVQSMNSMLGEICAYDKDIKALIITKTLDNTCYLFLPNNIFLQKIDSGMPFCSELLTNRQGRLLLGSRNLKYMDGNNKVFDEDVYAIAGIVHTNLEREDEPYVTRVAICYSTDSLTKTFENEQITSSEANYYITTLSDGAAIYKPNYAFRTDRFNYIAGFDRIKESFSSGVYKTEGDTMLTRQITDIQRNYAVFYTVPERVVSELSFLDMMMLFGLVISSIAIISFLSLLSAHLMKQRMNGLVKGMEQLEQTNFKYRIPEDRRNDEFTYISSRFNKMSRRLAEQIEKTYTLEMKRKAAEYHSLQASINPHFLYNTLEAIREWLDLSGEEDGAEMVVMLSRLMNYQIRGGHFVTIGEEVDKLKIYVELFLLRYNGEFYYDIDIPAEILSTEMPKYTLQPILENYFVHGYMQEHNNIITVSARQEGEDICIVITDNGKGMGSPQLMDLRRRLDNPETSGESLGLSNVHDRLRIIYGKTYGLTIESKEGMGTTVVVRFLNHIPK